MTARLRALLKLGAFVLLAFVLFPLKSRWIRVSFQGVDSSILYLLDHLIELAAILVFTAVAARWEHRPFGNYGLPWGRALKWEFWVGSAAGLLSLTALMMLLAGLGATRVSPTANSVLGAIGFGVLYALVLFLLAAREEFFYRGFGLLALTEAAGFWPAAAVTSAWFAWSHAGRHETPWGLATVAAFGLVACLSLRRTGNLWMAIGFHTFWNWAQTYLFGVSNSGHTAGPQHLLTSVAAPASPAAISGGVVGPEGSVFATVLLVLLGIACLRFLRAARYPAA